MYALKFRFRECSERLMPEAFPSVLCDLIAAHANGFPILRTQVYYPDGTGDTPPDEFMIEVADAGVFELLIRFLESRPDIEAASICRWDPVSAMSPFQQGMWCSSYHAGHLRPLATRGAHRG